MLSEAELIEIEARDRQFADAIASEIEDIESEIEDIEVRLKVSVAEIKNLMAARSEDLELLVQQIRNVRKAVG